VRLRLTGDDGKPLVVTIPSLGTASEFTMALAPGATRMVQTDGAGNLVAGAATVTTYTRIGLSAIFSIYDTAGNFVTEAGVGDSQTVIGFVIPVDITGDFNTGLALFNPEPVETTVDLTLLDATGKESGKKSLKLAPGGHLARFIAGPDQLFPSTTDFRGMLSVRRSTYIPALTLRQHGTPLSYTSLPVVDIFVGQLSFILPHVANGS
jgi:hypothetical protein